MSTITTNVEKFGLKDFQVRLRWEFYGEPREYWKVVENDGSIREVDRNTACSMVESGEMTPAEFSFNRCGIPVLAKTVESPENTPYSLLRVLENPSMTDCPDVEAERQYYRRWSVQIIDHISNEVIGNIEEGAFRYNQAPTLREAIGWAWASDLGRTRELDPKLLNEATRSITSFVISHGWHSVQYDSWEKEFHQWFKRDLTCRYDGMSHMNPTWQVATRVVLGQAMPPFNVCW